MQFVFGMLGTTTPASEVVRVVVVRNLKNMGAGSARLLEIDKLFVFTKRGLRMQREK